MSDEWGWDMRIRRQGQGTGLHLGKTTNSSGLTGLLGLCSIKLKDFREVEQQRGVWEDLLDDPRGYGI